MAQIDAFLKLDGIKGEAQDNDHKAELEIISWGWTMANSSSATFGTGSGTGKVSIGELIVLKRVDSSTSSLLQSVTTGKHIGSGSLVVRKATGGAALPYYQLDMKEMWVTSVEQGDLHQPENAQVGVETIKFTFVGHKFTYTQQNEDGSKGQAYSNEYNVKTNQPTMG